MKKLTEDQLKIIQNQLKWNRIGHIIGFSLLALFLLALIIESIRVNYFL